MAFLLRNNCGCVSTMCWPAVGACTVTGSCVIAGITVSLATLQPIELSSWSLTCATGISSQSVPKMAAGLNSTGRIYCFPGEIDSTLSPMNFVPSSTLTARFSTTRKLVSAIRCPICVTCLKLPRTLSGVPAADRSPCGFIRLMAVLRDGSIASKRTRFGPTPVSRTAWFSFHGQLGSPIVSWAL